MSTECFKYLLTSNHRIPVTASINGTAQDLTGKTIIVIHRNGDLVTEQTIGNGVQLEAGTGAFSYLMTPATLALIGITAPGTVITTINIKNANATLLMDGQAAIEVNY